MAKKIKGMTARYGDQSSSVIRKMMVRYINEDWDYDVIEYLDKAEQDICDDGKISRKDAIDILDYWKYMFLNAKGQKQEAMRYLKKAYWNGGADALAQYGYFYFTGQEIAKLTNREKAKLLFENALSQKSMFVEYLYAEAITYKNDSIEAYKEAIPYYQTALEKGVILARLKLAKCYIKTGIKLNEVDKLLEKCEFYEDEEKIKEVRNLKQNNIKKGS